MWKRLSDEAVKKLRVAPHPRQMEKRKRERISLFHSLCPPPPPTLPYLSFPFQSLLPPSSAPSLSPNYFPPPSLPLCFLLFHHAHPRLSYKLFTSSLSIPPLCVITLHSIFPLPNLPSPLYVPLTFFLSLSHFLPPLSLPLSISPRLYPHLPPSLIPYMYISLCCISVPPSRNVVELSSGQHSYHIMSCDRVEHVM